MSIQNSTKYVELRIFYTKNTQIRYCFLLLSPFRLCTMNVKGIFGKNLKYYRKEKKLSQEQLSENVDITVKHLSEIERGIVFASAGLIEKLAKNLDIPIFVFFLTDNSVYYDNIMLTRIEKTIIQNIEQAIEHTMDSIRKGVLNKSL